MEHASAPHKAPGDDPPLGDGGAKFTVKKPAAKRKPRKRKPPDMPRRPLSAYNLFFKATRAKLLEEQRASGLSGGALFSAMGKEIARRWKALSPEEAEEFKASAEDEMTRYRRDMDEWAANPGRRRKKVPGRYKVAAQAVRDWQSREEALDAAVPEDAPRRQTGSGATRALAPIVGQTGLLFESSAGGLSRPSPIGERRAFDASQAIAAAAFQQQALLEQREALMARQLLGASGLDPFGLSTSARMPQGLRLASLMSDSSLHQPQLARELLLSQLLSAQKRWQQPLARGQSALPPLGLGAALSLDPMIYSYLRLQQRGQSIIPDAQTGHSAVDRSLEHLLPEQVQQQEDKARKESSGGKVKHV